LKKTKVFCIGFHKTGTTSIQVALRTLGYRVTGPNGVQDPKIAENIHRLIEETVPQFDAFQDNPWPIVYKELDEKYPGSKFILLMRNPDSWIKSQVGHFGLSQTPMRRWIYGDNAGCPQGNEAIYLRRYLQHNMEVLLHFRDRPQDLLVMDLGKGDGWEKLCPFLGERIPGRPFPHVNKAEERAAAPAATAV